MKCKPDIIFHHEKVPFWVGGWRTMMERVGSLLNTKFHYFMLETKEACGWLKALVPL